MNFPAALAEHAAFLCWPMAVAFLAVTSAVTAGGTMRSLAGDRDPRLAERFLIGTLVLSSWSMTLAATHVLYPFLAVLPLLVLPLIGAIFCLHAARRILGELWEKRHGMDSVEIAVVALIVAGIVIGAIVTTVPPSGMDALTYHLALPDRSLIHHGLPPATNAYDLYWQQYEMAILPLIALDRSGTAANIWGWFVFLALVELSLRAGRQYGGRTGGHIAALAAATSPLVLTLLALTKNDLLACALVLAAVEAFHRAQERDATSFLCGLFAGAALAVKPTTAFALVPLALAHADRLRRLDPKNFPALAIFPGFWAARNVVASGSPLAPGFLASSAFRTASGVAGFPAWLGLPLAQVRHLVLSFFETYLDGSDGPIGVLLFGLLVALCCRAGSPEANAARRRFTVAGVIGVAFWSVAGHGQSRFLLPLMLALTPMSAALPIVARTRILWIAAAVFSLSASAALERDYGFCSWHAGFTSTDAFLGRWLDSYAVQKEADRVLPRDAKVIAVGDAELFPLHRDARFDAYWEPSLALHLAHESHSAEDLRRRLRDLGFSHVLYNPGILRSLIARGATPPPECERDLPVLEEMVRASAVVCVDRRGIVVCDLRVPKN